MFSESTNFVKAVRRVSRLTLEDLNLKTELSIASFRG